MRRNSIIFLYVGCFLWLFACGSNNHKAIENIAVIAKGWRGEIIAKVDQSYVGWDVEIGDADNDGKNEILTTGCPNSRLYMSQKKGNKWKTTRVADNLAQSFPGMGLAVKIVDLNLDSKNEIILGTGQETGGTAFFYAFQLDGEKIVKNIFSRPNCNQSSYTHNLATYDLDGDGILEVISAYCGGGEIIRYDLNKSIKKIETRKLYQLSGSGEESLIADVDNDGKVEYITSNSYRHDAAKIEIFEFDENGELIIPPRIILEGFEGKGCFYASAIVGDVDNDGGNELIVGWKRKRNINKATLLGYRVKETATPIYTFAYEDEHLDLAYFEKMMVVADADNDGLNELVVSTRGDEMAEKLTSKHLGHVFMYEVAPSTELTKTLLLNFNDNYVESSWVAVGDADNDGSNEIILATGKGDRTKIGNSYVVLVEKAN